MPNANVTPFAVNGSAARTRIVRAAPAIVIGLSAWCALLLLIWNIDRGFDLTDESFLLYLYRHPGAFQDRLYWQHFGVVSTLLPASLDHVITYRIIKLAGLLAMSGMFAIVLHRWIARRHDGLADHGLHPVVLVHFLALGAFLAYCHGSQTLSYNDFTTFCLLAAAIALIAIDLCPPGFNDARWNFLFSSVAGAILVPQFFAKWPAGVLLAVFILAFSSLLAAGRWRALAISIAGAVCGAALMAFLTTDAGVGRLFSLANLFAAINDPSGRSDHRGPAELLLQYAATSIQRLIDLLRDPAAAAVLILPVATLVVRAATRGTRAQGAWTTVLAVASLVALVVFAATIALRGGDGVVWFDRFRIADLQTFLVLFAFAGACCCVPFLPDTMSRRSAVMFLAVVALIALLPAVGAIGTNNALLTQFIRHMAPLFAALAMLTMLLGFAGRWRPFAPVVCAVVAVLSTAQLFVTLLYHPYRLARPGTEQTVVLAEPPHMRGLKVDAPTADFVRTLLADSQRAVGLTAGVPVLALFDSPGALYILDAIAVGHPWHLPGNAAMDKATCDRVKADPLTSARLRMIVLDRDQLSPDMMECLRQARIDLTAYNEVARIAIPAPLHGQQMLRLLVPR